LTVFALTVAGVSCATTTQPRPPKGAYADTPEPSAALQARVMDLADDYISGLSEAIYITLGNDQLSPQARALAQSFLRNGVGAAVDIGAGPNPSIGLLDLLVLSDLQTRTFESHWIPAGIGPAGNATLERLKRLDASLWSSSSDLLTKRQQDVLRQLIDAWIAQNPDRMVVSLVRFQEFADSRTLSSAALRRQASGLLKEVTVVSSAIDDARLLGERLLWYSGRYPYVLGQQAELTMYRLAAQPESREVLKSLDAVNALAGKVEAELDKLPEVVGREQQRFFESIAGERAKAIEQAEQVLARSITTTLEDIERRYRVERDQSIDVFIDRFGNEARQLIDRIDSGQKELRGVVTEVRDTVTVANSLAKEITGTVDAIDRVVTRFANDPANPSEPLKMEDIREIAEAAEITTVQVTRAIEELNELVNSGAIEKRVAEITGPLNAVVDRAFYRGLILVIVLLVGLALLKLIPRRTAAA
jgi:hypothetical protein